MLAIEDASLHVNRTELIIAFKTIRKMTKSRPKGDALVSYSSGKIAITILGLTVRARAEGTWDGTARIPAAFFMPLVTVPPTSDPVQVRVANERLYIEGLSAYCIWESNERQVIQMPINATLRDLLIMGLRHSLDEIIRSGLHKHYEDATQKRDELIIHAANTLAPLGIMQDDVIRLVEHSLNSENLR